MTNTIDIISNGPYPSSYLSNFYPHRFVYDNVQCESMEGFLQALKFPDRETQKLVCGLVGLAAKRIGKPQPWYKTQTLFWNGVVYNRHARPYENLITSAYDSLYIQCPEYVDALNATRNSALIHSIGKRDPYRTILTEKEFCDQLYRLRES